MKTVKAIPLQFQILIALAAAVLCGWLSGDEGALWGILWVDVFDFFGTLFLNALKMLIVPLVMASIICGVMGMGTGKDLGRLTGRTVLYYLCTSLVAILIGLTLVNLFQPGLIDGEPLQSVLGLQAEGGEVAEQVAGRGHSELVQIFIRMVPPNVVKAAAEGQMLGLIFFSILLGSFMARVKGEPGRVLESFWTGISEAMLKMTDWVMLFAPIGVFALVAKVVATLGLGVFKPLLLFFFTVVSALGIHAFVVLPLFVAVLGRRNPWSYMRAMSPALLTAFSTSSSSATLPLTIDCAQRRGGVSPRTSSFVLPLGATVNMDGTALYECVAALFIAQAYGVTLGFAAQFQVVLIALLTSVGVAGIPSASLVAIAIILGAVGLPLEGVGLILAVDRLLDMCRTGVNVFGDSCGALILDRFQKPSRPSAAGV